MPECTYTYEHFLTQALFSAVTILAIAFTALFIYHNFIKKNNKDE